MSFTNRQVGTYAQEGEPASRNYFEDMRNIPLRDEHLLRKTIDLISENRNIELRFFSRTASREARHLLRRNIENDDNDLVILSEIYFDAVGFNHEIDESNACGSVACFDLKVLFLNEVQILENLLYLQNDPQMEDYKRGLIAVNLDQLENLKRTGLLIFLT